MRNRATGQGTCCKLVVNAMQSILYAINLLKSIQYVLLNGTTVRVWKEPERSMLPDYWWVFCINHLYQGLITILEQLVSCPDPTLEDRYPLIYVKYWPFNVQSHPNAWVQAVQKLTTMAFRRWSKLVAGDTQGRWSLVAEGLNAHRIEALLS